MWTRYSAEEYRDWDLQQRCLRSVGVKKSHGLSLLREWSSYCSVYPMV
jgi:hypothetical protein